MADIAVAVKTAVSHPAGYRPMPRLQRTTKLAVKMLQGQCTDNSVERAEHLVQEYRDFWRHERGGDPAARARQARLSRYLLRVSDEATSATLEMTPRGPAFWQELQRRLDNANLETIPAEMDSDLILGGVCDLASQCKVWFSDRFDVDTVVARLHHEQGRAS
ncbi:hypothetical protein ACIBI3_11355 [Actinomadura luteofluorescens]|uniref:hypothetical protein n=1 Tax=Actinomadura luteofluorescens TaxID=46163 RepID=UPI003475182C